MASPTEQVLAWVASTAEMPDWDKRSPVRVLGAGAGDAGPATRPGDAPGSHP
ncbi:hypothetical protein [Streptomyces sp. NPDC058092]|uniref:hypothetical protein n=1 Tax=Streptomyces sp. NPDC058092 TaxID=3346336 RepID=UPI0036EE5DAB